MRRIGLFTITTLSLAVIGQWIIVTAQTTVDTHTTRIDPLVMMSRVVNLADGDIVDYSIGH